ncbi:mechanosensitive ion channel protein MscS [Bacteroidia bacterium]|nr:mechanosensitive ion channel protein MscS [Bacteroidia bacterium]
MKHTILFFACLLASSICLPAKADTIGHPYHGTPVLASEQVPIQESVQTPSLERSPVVLSDDTLFYVYAGIGGINVKKRADIVAENIAALTTLPFFDADSLCIEENAGECNIVYKQSIIFAVTTRQADELQLPKRDLAEMYVASILQAVTAARSTIVWKTVLIRIAEGLLLLVVTYFLLKYLNIFYRRTRLYILTRKDKTIKKLYYIVDANKQIAIEATILRIIRLALYILVLYFFLLFLFMLVPGTKWLSTLLLGYIVSPLKAAFFAVWNYIPDLIVIVIIIFIFKYVIKAIRIIADKIANESISVNGFHPEWTSATFNIIKVILYVFMFILIFPHLPNADSGVFQGVTVFMGLLISLGSTSLIGNLMAGLVITYMRPFKIGDRIKVAENLGNVIEKNSLVTRIRTTKNEIVTIPNSSITSGQTINYSASAEEYGLILHTQVTMGYEISWRRMHELLIEAARQTSYVQETPQPYVLQTALDDSYVRYEINIYTNNANAMLEIYSELNQNIQDIFNREGIELMAPHVYGYRKMEEAAIPPQNNIPN